MTIFDTILAPLRLRPSGRRQTRAEPFLIFALARTGSTTLRLLLECHPAVSCVHEPFNPDRRPAHDCVADAEGLRRELREIRERHSGIKHVWDATGWPFPNDSPLNRALPALPGQRILFLNRRNFLRRLVSHQMARQAKAWGLRTEDRAAVMAFAFAPLDTETLEFFLVREGSAVAESRRMIVESGNPLLELWYEDLFDPETSVDDKERMLATIFEFLGLDPALPPARRNRVRMLLRPEPLNSAATYRRIPGIDDVEARFGSDATGYLFR